MPISQPFRIPICLCLLAALGCGGGSGTGQGAPAPAALQIQPPSLTLPGEEAQTFQAVLTGSATPGVTWSVVEGPTGGAISADGLYTAPSEPGDFHVRAVSITDNAVRAEATVKVTGKLSVSLTPTTATLVAGGAQAFAATVPNATDPRVTWSATGGTISLEGLYTAPGAPGTYTVQATSVQNTRKFATATVTVTSGLPSAAGPRVLLNDPATLNGLKAALASGSAPAARFRAVVDGEMAAPGTYYAFEARHAALMYQLTGTPAYGTFAIALTEAFVASEEALINANQRATIAGDSYLEVGSRLGNVAQVYDWCFDLLTPAQRTRWITYMNRVLFNVWNPDQAVWGAGAFPWSGWSINNPANNYYYSFLEATMLTGLATFPENPQAQQWRDHFATTKIASQLMPMFNADLVGGGSREGTGYGTAMKNLFRLYFLWEKSTGHAIADLTPHTRLTAYWMAHATVPTLDKLAPIGDHARDSTAALFDYHRELWLSLIAQYPEDAGVRATKQLLADSSVPRMEHSFQFWADFLYDRPAVTPLPLTTLNTAYYGPGTGNLFTRSSWAPTATYAHFIAGPYSESHAHRDQGSFLLYRGDWLLDDQNLRSHSGIELDEEMHNLVRFVSAGQTVTMAEGGPETEMLALADHAQFTYALANTLPTYNGKAQVVKSEREFLFLKPGTLVIFDRTAANGAGVARVFGLNMALAPTITGDHLALVRGGHRADVHRVAPVGVPWTTTAYGAGFSGGMRADASHSVGTESLFLHIISTDGDVASVTANHVAGATGAALTFADGRTAIVRFSNSGRGGTLDFRAASGAVLFDGALPTTVTVPALFPVP